MTCLEILRSFDRSDNLSQRIKLVAANGDELLDQLILPLPPMEPGAAGRSSQNVMRSG